MTWSDLDLAALVQDSSQRASDGADETVVLRESLPHDLYYLTFIKVAGSR